VPSCRYSKDIDSFLKAAIQRTKFTGTQMAPTGWRADIARQAIKKTRVAK